MLGTLSLDPNRVQPVMATRKGHAGEEGPIIDRNGGESRFKPARLNQNEQKVLDFKDNSSQTTPLVFTRHCSIADSENKMLKSRPRK
ncbi:hypothetical protein FKM82_030344 [Ascaphus truei]